MGAGSPEDAPADLGRALDPRGIVSATDYSPRRVEASDSARLEELCRVASDTARRRGHDLAGWAPGADGDLRAQRAVCRSCGKVAYVRVGSGMSGLAGEALMQPCSGAGRPVGQR